MANSATKLAGNRIDHFYYFDVGDPDAFPKPMGRLISQNLTTGALAAFPLDVAYPHSLVSRPNYPGQAAITSFHAFDVAIVETEKFSTVRKFTSKDYILYGHSAFSADGKKLFVSAFHEKKGGSLLVFDPDSMRLMGMVQDENFLPHDVRRSVDGRQLLAADRGWHSWPTAERRGHSRVCIIDVEQGKIISSVSVPDSDRYAIHLEPLALDSWLVLCQEANRETYPLRAPRASLVGTLKIGEDIKFLAANEHERISLGQNTFGAAYSSKYDVLAVTDQYRGGVLSFWSLNKRKFITSCGVLRPTAISLSENEEYFTVSSTNAGIYRISAQSLRVTQWFENPGVVHVAGHGFIDS